VVKALTVAAGLESGKFKLETLIDTTPGTLPVGNHVVRDIRKLSYKANQTLDALIKADSNWFSNTFLGMMR
jgi:cell division protein FtsI (penicillin-binding protein 3)